ncbi:MAG: lysyl oxidase family protein, partial [bacterium]
HINNVAIYELRKGAPDGPTVAQATKVTFCMIDLYHQYPEMPSSPPDGSYFGCNDQYQGLSVGFSDIYSAGLPDQWIVVNDLPRGIYYLVSTVDPTHQFIERDDYGEGAHANNPAWVKNRLDPVGLTVQVLDSGLGDPTLRR